MPHAIIIGGGIAGLATAVWLAKDGWRITLLERRPILGGRAYTFTDPKTQSPVDNGQHLLMGCYTHTLAFLREIGSEPLLERQTRLSVPLVTEDGNHWTFAGIFRAKALPWRDRANFLMKAGPALFSYQYRGIPEKWKTCSARDWFGHIGQSRVAQRRFWDILTYATLNESPERAHAHGLITVLIQGLLRSRRDSQLLFPPAGGLSSLYVDPARRYLEQRGAQIICSRSVERIHGSKVLTTNGELMGDVIVSAVPARAYAKLLERSQLPREDVPEETSPIVSINFWFDRSILESGRDPSCSRILSFIGVAERQIHWWFERKERGDLWHVIAVASGARHLLESSKEEIEALALQELRDLFPKAKDVSPSHSLINKEREATFALTAENERCRPPQWGASPQFYRVGDWTRTGLPATLESAVKSAWQCVSKIREQWRTGGP